jgi:hypothetical protein
MKTCRKEPGHSVASVEDGWLVSRRDENGHEEAVALVATEAMADDLIACLLGFRILVGVSAGTVEEIGSPDLVPQGISVFVVDRDVEGTGNTADPGFVRAVRDSQEVSGVVRAWGEPTILAPDDDLPVLVDVQQKGRESRWTCDPGAGPLAALAWSADDVLDKAAGKGLKLTKRQAERFVARHSLCIRRLATWAAAGRAADLIDDLLTAEFAGQEPWEDERERLALNERLEESGYQVEFGSDGKYCVTNEVGVPLKLCLDLPSARRWLAAHGVTVPDAEESPAISVTFDDSRTIRNRSYAAEQVDLFLGGTPVPGENFAVRCDGERWLSTREDVTSWLVLRGLSQHEAQALLLDAIERKRKRQRAE